MAKFPEDTGSMDYDARTKSVIRQVIRDELEVKVTLNTDYVTDKVQGVTVELYLGDEQICWDEGD